MKKIINQKLKSIPQEHSLHLNTRTTFGLTSLDIQKIHDIAAIATRYSLVFILLNFGFYKFFDFEAAAIEPLVGNSPFMSWLYSLFSVKGVSALIGGIEIIIGIMILLRPWYPKISATGSLAAVLIFFSTLTFLISTPDMWSIIEGVPVPTDDGFIFKDLTLLAGSLWTAAEALRAAHLKTFNEAEI